MLQIDYPPQRPLSLSSEAYSAELWRRGATVPYSEVHYGNDVHQRIAFVVPERPNGTIFVFFHGGNWTCGYKEWNLFMAPLFREAGIIFASPGYRLAPWVTFDEILTDCVRGLDWINRNVVRLGGNARRVFVGGHSAGGHLASLLALRKMWKKQYGIPTDFIRGCLPISGIFGLTDGLELAEHLSSFPTLSTGEASALSPILQIEPPAPPFLISYGENDHPHLINQAQRMISQLRMLKSKVDEITIANKTHNEAHVSAGDPDGQWARAALRFIAEN